MDIAGEIVIGMFGAMASTILGLFVWNFKRGTDHAARIAVLESRIELLDGIKADIRGIFASQKETCERIAKIEGKLGVDT